MPREVNGTVTVLVPEYQQIHIEGDDGFGYAATTRRIPELFEMSYAEGQRVVLTVEPAGRSHVVVAIRPAT